jgi:hypothetical protein
LLIVQIVRDRLDQLLPAPLADFAAAEATERERVRGVARRRGGLTRMARISSALASADRRKAAAWTNAYRTALPLSLSKGAGGAERELK